DLEIRRVLNAPLDKVWEAWSKAENLKQWFCPVPWTVPVAEMDLRPGGRFYTQMAGPNGERSDNEGVFLEVVPHERITFTNALTEGFRPTGG
ncbi:SRPBCC domain-containing protein, partial [Acinetobacter baumannii]